MAGLLALVLLAAGPSPDPEPAIEERAEPSHPEGDESSMVRTLVVTGTRTERTQSDAPVATQVYDRTEIEQSGAENLAEVLEETPGVQVSRGIVWSALLTVLGVVVLSLALFRFRRDLGPSARTRRKLAERAAESGSAE